VKVKGWWLLWCGHLCYGGPYRTKAEAKRALAELEQARINAKQPGYGNYTIERWTRDTDQK